MVTNGDNLYAKSLFRYVYPKMVNATGVIGFHFISHHNWPIGAKQVERNGRDVLLRTKLKVGWVDLGAVFFYAKLLRDAGSEARFTDCREWWTADGRFIERMMRRPNVTSDVIDRVLFFHQ